MVVRLLALLVALLVGATGNAAAAQRFIPLMQPGEAVPPIPLVAQDGRSFSLDELHGKAVALSFIYTRCGDARMCPLVSAKFARAQSAIGSEPIRLVILTLDPTFDTPHVLERYGRAFNQNPKVWTLATGSQASIEELAGRFGIATAVTAPGVIIHTEAAVILGPDGRLARIVYGNDWTAGDLVGYARESLAASSRPASAFRAWLSTVAERCGASGVVLGGTAMLGLLGLAMAVVGGAFWFAFRDTAKHG